MIKLLDILKEVFIKEHYAGLEYPSGDNWGKTVAASKDYLKSKGVDDKTIAYWTRPETKEDHQENIHIPFVYNDAILNKVNFNFKYIPNFDAKSIKLDPNIEAEREKKFQNTLNTGTEYFKGIPVKGNTPEERLKYITKTTSDFLKSDKAYPVTIINKDGEMIIADGAHRIWVAQKLNLPLKAYIITSTN